MRASRHKDEQGKSIGIVITLLLVLALVAIGVWKMTEKNTLPANTEVSSCTPLQKKTVGVYGWYKNPSDEWPRIPFAQLAAACINTLYLDITSFVNSPVAAPVNMQLLDSVVQCAQENHIVIVALAGDPEWTTPHATEPGQIVDFVERYNNRQGNRSLLSLQFDVEPWGLPSWGENREHFTSQYLSFMNEVVDAWSATTSAQFATLSFAIPYWFDARGPVPTLMFNGTSASTLEHINAILARAPHTALNVMASRNTVEGRNGIVQLTEDEVRVAANSSQKISVVIVFDTTDTHEPHTTYFGLTKARLMSDMQHTSQYYAVQSGFSGVAVNDVAGLVALR